MSEEIDWLHSRRGMCKVDLYSPTGQQGQDWKVIHFVDVSTLNGEDKDSQGAAGCSSEGTLNLEEKEITVIMHPEKQVQSKAEGSVCFFKQTPPDPLSVLSWFRNDLQTYALGFQHALSPSACISKHKVGDIEGSCLSLDCLNNGPHSRNLEVTEAKNTNNDQSSSSPSAKYAINQRTVFFREGKCAMNDPSFYNNQLSSPVFLKTHKEIKKLGGASEVPSIYLPRGGKGKISPHSVVSKITSEMAHDAVEVTSAETHRNGEECTDGSRETFPNGELSNRKKGGDKQMDPRVSNESADSISKGHMICANRVASDMMASVTKTLNVRTSGNPVSACVVLKRVLLKHTQEIVSDLIDSCLRNTHNITGVLMTDPDFVSAVKRNLFHHGKQNATDIMEAMLKRLVNALLGEQQETESQCFAYAALKASSHDPKGKNQGLESSALKAEMRGKNKCKVKGEECKSLTSAEKVGEHILEESLTLWNQNQGNQGKLPSNPCPSKEEKRQKISPSTDSLAKDLIVSALRLIQYHLTQQVKGKDASEEDCPVSTSSTTQSARYEKCGGTQCAKALSMKHQEPREAPEPSTSQKEDQHMDSQKVDMSTLFISLIQNLLNESPFTCEDICESENKRSEAKTNKTASVCTQSQRREEPRQDHQEFDFIGGMKQVNRQFIDQLIQSVMKLRLIMAKCSNNGGSLADLEEQASLANNALYHASNSRCNQGAGTSQSHQDSSGHKLIVRNQCSISNLQKQLQAVLQWIAASQVNIPRLYFMGDDDGQLEKLPEVSALAAEKGYSVGDLIQEVVAFSKELQLDEVVENTTGEQLLDWLLTHL